MLSNVEIFVPKTINELDAQLGSAPSAAFISGGTDLMVNQERWQSCRTIINLDSVSELKNTIDWQDGSLLIGGAVPMSCLIRDDEINKQFPILIKALKLIGSVQIQNRATLGGNIANASPAGDSLPVLSVLGAEILTGPQQQGQFQKVPVDEMMTGPGETILNTGNYIAFIRVPLQTSAKPDYWYYRKVGQREALAISKVSLALSGKMAPDGTIGWVRITTGSVTPVIRRSLETEKYLTGNRLSNEIIQEAVRLLKEEVSPINDIRSTIEYRRHTAGELLREALSNFMSIHL